MPIKFPAVDDEPLATPPLDEVVCQVRFPPILKINTEEPVELQESIRDYFPEFEKRHTFQFQLPLAGNPIPPSTENRPITFVFSDVDKEVQATLSPSFYAVSTKRYRGWQHFLEHLQVVHSAVTTKYRPAYATRIGLRYINRLTTENTKATTRQELFMLVREELTVLLRGEVWDNADEMVGIVNFADPPAQMNLRFGYEVSESVPAFLLDFDYFEEGQIELSEVTTRCGRYHDAIYSAFRWVVRDDALSQFGSVMR